MAGSGSRSGLDDEYYRGLINETDDKVAQARDQYRGAFNEEAVPDWPDYVIKQHSLIGLWLGVARQEPSVEQVQNSLDADFWRLERPKRQALAVLALLVPLWLSLIVSVGGVFWTSAICASLTAAGVWGCRRALLTMSDAQYRLVFVWPHAVLGLVGLLALWDAIGLLVCPMPSMCFQVVVVSLILWAAVEAAMRGAMWYFKWWPPMWRGPGSAGPQGASLLSESRDPYVPPRGGA